MKLTCEQWRRIEPVILSLSAKKDPRGRRLRYSRQILNAIFWNLRTGAAWKELLLRYPPHQTYHRRFQHSIRQGIFQRIAQEFVEDLYERGQIDIRETFLDDCFAPAKKVLLSVKTKRGKYTKIQAIADACGFSVAAHVESASPHEVKLVEATIESSFTRYAPDKLVGDKAYDSDSLDQQLFKERGVEIIASHRRRRKRSSMQDGRKLRRYRRRWKVERLFA
jgi:transposase